MARGFQESLKPQSDSPIASKESFKLLMAIAANFRFKLAPVNIRAAFLEMYKDMYELLKGWDERQFKFVTQISDNYTVGKTVVIKGVNPSIEEEEIHQASLKRASLPAKSSASWSGRHQISAEDGR